MDHLGRTPLFLACEKEDIEKVKLLYEEGPKEDIDQPNRDDWTPLFISVEKANLQLVKFLVNQGANPGRLDSRGNTPMHAACVGKFPDHLRIVKFLHTNGANLSLLNSNGCTPFYFGSFGGNLEIVQWLYSNAANDMNVASNSNKTPFAIACEKNNIECVTWFIHQADQMDLLLKDYPQHLNALNHTNKCILFQHALHLRDVEHESYLTLLTISKTTLNVDTLKYIGDFIIGSKKSRVVWINILQQGAPVKKKKKNRYGRH